MSKNEVILEKNHVDMLNILRFIAFAIVFLLHSKIFMASFSWNAGCDFAWLFYTPAWAGVWIFFLLSGYGIGSGFYQEKYELSFNGIIRFYLRRLNKLIPLYWFYLIVVLLFIRTDLLLPSKEHVTYLIKLFLFNYQEEFLSTEFGLAWYVTTLLRLYLTAPLGYWILKKIIKNRKQTYIAIFLLVAAGFLFRCVMGYHIVKTGVGNWSYSIYKPFYCNLDIFLTGMLINNLKKGNRTNSAFFVNIGRYLIFLTLIVLILFNSYIYYASSYNGKDYMDIYYYVLPSVYILVVSVFIIFFDILKAGTGKQAHQKLIHKNPLRIFNNFSKIQFPMYLFHSTVLLCLQNNYNDEIYNQICHFLHISENYIQFAKGCLFTIFAFLFTAIWSCIIYQIILKKSYHIIPCSENINFHEKAIRGCRYTLKLLGFKK